MALDALDALEAGVNEDYEWTPQSGRKPMPRKPRDVLAEATYASYTTAASTVTSATTSESTVNNAVTAKTVAVAATVAATPTVDRSSVAQPTVVMKKMPVKSCLPARVGKTLVLKSQPRMDRQAPTGGDIERRVETETAFKCIVKREDVGNHNSGEVDVVFNKTEKEIADNHNSEKEASFKCKVEQESLSKRKAELETIARRKLEQVAIAQRIAEQDIITHRRAELEASIARATKLVEKRRQAEQLAIQVKAKFATATKESVRKVKEAALVKEMDIASAARKESGQPKATKTTYESEASYRASSVSVVDAITLQDAIEFKKNRMRRMGVAHSPQTSASPQQCMQLEVKRKQDIKAFVDFKLEEDQRYREKISEEEAALLKDKSPNRNKFPVRTKNLLTIVVQLTQTIVR